MLREIKIFSLFSPEGIFNLMRERGIFARTNNKKRGVIDSNDSCFSKNFNIYF